jgi:7-keto-8-aminopelargonate synthetase-like enzyme
VQQSPLIQEIDRRHIRIGDQWLIDFASCNYLGFDVDPEIMDAVAELGQPACDPARLTAPLGAHPTHVMPMSGRLNSVERRPDAES